MQASIGAPEALLTGGLLARPALGMLLRAPRFLYRVECFDASGAPQWVEEFENLVTTVGRTDIIDKYFKGSGYTAAWACGLAGAGTKAASDTMASHAAWPEVTAYSAATRPAISWGTTSGGSNTASAVSFSMNASYTVAGAFIGNDTTKGGTTGTLYSVGDFSSARSGGSGDTLQVTLTVSAT